MKKILFVFMVVLLCAGLTACGDEPKAEEKAKVKFEGIHVGTIAYSNLTEFDSSISDLFVTFLSAAQYEDIDTIKKQEQDLKTIILSNMKDKETIETVNYILDDTGKTSMSGIIKNTLTYDRDISDLEMTIVERELKQLCELEVSKFGFDSNKEAKLAQVLGNHLDLD